MTLGTAVCLFAQAFSRYYVIQNLNEGLASWNGFIMTALSAGAFILCWQAIAQFNRMRSGNEERK